MLHLEEKRRGGDEEGRGAEETRRAKELFYGSSRGQKAQRSYSQEPSKCLQQLPVSKAAAESC